MKSAFYYQQELRSSEFGHLLYNVVPKGVYEAPQIQIQGNVVTVSGGCYMLYDNSQGNEYAIRISYDSSEVLASSTAASSGQYIYIQFTYNSNRKSDPEIVLSNTALDSTTAILLGVVRTNSSGSLYIDTTDMEMMGPGKSYPSPSISSIEYDPRGGTLKVEFNGYFQTNNSTQLVTTLETSGIDMNKAYQIYVDQTGTAQIRETVSSNMGKTILAYKNAGDTVFTPYRYSHRAEITADSLTLQPITPAQSNDKLANIYTDSDSKNAAGEVILSKVVQRLVAEVQQLREEVGASNGSEPGTIWASLGGLSTDITNKNTFTNITVTGTANFTGTVNFTGANIHFANGTLGSRNNPITKLYVSDVLYATHLQYFSN